MLHYRTELIGANLCTRIAIVINGKHTMTFNRDTNNADNPLPSCATLSHCLPTIFMALQQEINLCLKRRNT